jgi:hypothetical protein
MQKVKNVLHGHFAANTKDCKEGVHITIASPLSQVFVIYNLLKSIFLTVIPSLEVPSSQLDNTFWDTTPCSMIDKC